ncbi:MAG: aspartate kinase [Methyloligella sp. ZOD6]
MALLVLKFGGTSVADIDKIRNAARHVKREIDAGHACAVVVSAMAGQTNQLIAWVEEAARANGGDAAGGDSQNGETRAYDACEYDAVVSSGEQVTAGLLALVLQSLGVRARSWQGWQIPLNTDPVHAKARIAGIEGHTLKGQVLDGEVAVVAGFQGIAPDGRIATLGRGGSDTSAVALAAALDADRCDIYTDVDGVYTTDPRIVPQAQRMDRISYEEMLEMASQGAKVLQTRSVELAMQRSVPVLVRSSFDSADLDAKADIAELGTLVCEEDEIVEQKVVSGIAYAPDEAKVTLIKVADKPGVAAGVFGPLAEANINVDMIVQNVSEDGRYTDLTFTVQSADLERALDVLRSKKDEIGYADLDGSTNVAKVSAIGVGMRSHAGVAAQMFHALSEKGINIQAISTSEIKISILIDAAYAELAVRTLHTLFGLDSR